MTLLPWLVIGLLIAVNALYVAAEFSAVAVQKSQLAPLARDGNRRAAGLMEILKDGAQLDRRPPNWMPCSLECDERRPSSSWSWMSMEEPRAS
jgi:hypothetical protein